MDHLILIIDIFIKYIFIFNSFFMFIIIFTERKTPLHTLFWITLLIFTPYFGFFTFLFFGLSLKKSRFINKYYIKMKIQHSVHDFFHTHGYSDYWRNLVEYLAISQAGTISTYDESLFFSSGNEFFNSLKSDIINARNSIYMEYFIFKEDRLGEVFYNLIMDKAKEGVSIKLILDGFNSISYFKLKKLKKAGVEIELFLPFHFIKIFNLKVNYRNHKKLTIIDGKTAYIGGFNIGNEYIGDSYLGNWRDTAIKITGEIVHEFEKEFFSSWDFVLKSRKTDYHPYTLNHVSNKVDKNFSAQLVSSGPNFELRTARDNILKLIIGAKHSIFIETPYFIPDDIILNSLKIAAASGVKIKIIIPNVGDHLFVYWVNQSFIWELLECGAFFYRYNDGFLHSKFIVVDNEIATIGSVNLDYRSFYENFELNINLYSISEVTKLRNIFIEDLKKSTLITEADYGKRTVFTKFRESLFRLLSPML